MVGFDGAVNLGAAGVWIVGAEMRLAAGSAGRGRFSSVFRVRCFFAGVGISLTTFKSRPLPVFRASRVRFFVVAAVVLDNLLCRSISATIGPTTRSAEPRRVKHAARAVSAFSSTE